MNDKNRRNLTPVERDIIISSIALQLASYKRAINTNTDPELKDFYSKKLNLATVLMYDIQNLELF